MGQTKRLDRGLGVWGYASTRIALSAAAYSREQRSPQHNSSRSSVQDNNQIHFIYIVELLGVQ